MKFSDKQQWGPTERVLAAVTIVSVVLAFILFTQDVWQWYELSRHFGR